MIQSSIWLNCKSCDWNSAQTATHYHCFGNCANANQSIRINPPFCNFFRITLRNECLKASQSHPISIAWAHTHTVECVTVSNFKRCRLEYENNDEPNQFCQFDYGTLTVSKLCCDLNDTIIYRTPVKITLIFRVLTRSQCVNEAIFSLCFALAYFLPNNDLYFFNDLGIFRLSRKKY